MVPLQKAARGAQPAALCRPMAKGVSFAI